MPKSTGKGSLSARFAKLAERQKKQEKRYKAQNPTEKKLDNSKKGTIVFSTSNGIVVEAFDSALRTTNPISLINMNYNVLYQDVTDEPNVFRALLLMYKAEVVAGAPEAPVIGDILETGSVLSPINFSNRSRIRVIFDRTYLTSGTNSSNNVNFNIPTVVHKRIKKNFKGGKQLKALTTDMVWHPYLVWYVDIKRESALLEYNMATEYYSK